MGQYALTNLSGDPRFVAAKPRSRARYYQRPDRGVMANGLFTNAYDPTLTPLRDGGDPVNAAFYGRRTGWRHPARSRLGSTRP